MMIGISSLACLTGGFYRYQLCKKTGGYMQIELIQHGTLLNSKGKLSQIGWSGQPLLDCNLEAARFYSMRFFQRLRIKRSSQE